MIVDYIRILELKDRGLGVPRSLIEWAESCRDLVAYAAELGLARNVPIAAFSEVFKSGAGSGMSREQLFDDSRTLVRAIADAKAASDIT